MTIIRPEPRVAIPATTLLRPGLGQRLLAIAVPFLLAVGLPNEWFFNRELGDTRSGGGLTLVALVALTGMAWAILLPRLEISLRAIRLEPLIPLFVGGALLSTFWSGRPSATLQASVELVLVLLLAWWAVAVFDLDEILLYTSLALAAVSAISLAFVVALPQFGVSSGGWTGLAGNRNGLGRLAVLTVLHSLLAMQIYPRFRTAWLASAALGGLLVFGSTSKTSLLGLGGIVACVAIARAFRSRKTLFGAVGVSLVTTVGSIVGFATANLGFITTWLDRDVTFSGRTVLWRSSFGAFLERPFFGWGWEGFWHGYFSPAHDVLLENTWGPPHSHNALLEYGITLGIPGALVGGAILWRAVLRSTRVIAIDHSPAALFPFTIGVFAFVFSMTEFGVISRTVFFYCLIIATLSAERILKTATSPSRPLAVPNSPR